LGSVRGVDGPKKEIGEEQCNGKLEKSFNTLQSFNGKGKLVVFKFPVLWVEPIVATIFEKRH
jgi:hypothetical protein